MNIQNELETLAAKAISQIKTCTDEQAITAAEVTILGRKGSLTTILKQLKTLPIEQRKAVGMRANELKQQINDQLQAARNKLLDDVIDTRSVDVTLDGTIPPRGTLHPHTQMIESLNEAFLSLGFEIYEGPEITSELFAFDYLNFPPSHPARESMDTYWLKGTADKSGSQRLCLRPHLTGGSIRYMQQHQPPFRFVYPGRVFRSEATDAKHERTFYQYEALIIDKHIPFSAGKLMVDTILERVFHYPVETRMRAGFFPFVEPGFEIDMRLKENISHTTKGEKLTQWMEIMPGGPPHPNVLKAAGLDPAEWQGFYINIGLDRLVMMKHAIDDVRLFHGGDLRFLEQFVRI